MGRKRAIWAFIAAGVILCIALAIPTSIVLRRAQTPKKVVAVQQDPAVLMGRLATKFVGGPHSHWSGGVAFYEQPTPYNVLLCRVRTYVFADRVVKRSMDRGRADGDPMENLEAYDQFGIWAEPGSREAKQGSREQACAAFKDFDKLIGSGGFRGDGEAIERAINALGAAIQQAKLGQPKFRIACADTRKSPIAVPCDGLAYLRAASVRDIGDVQPLRTDYPWGDPAALPRDPEGATYWDHVGMRPSSPSTRSCGKDVWVHIRLQSRQHFGRQSSSDTDPEAVEISLTTLC